MKKIKTSIHAPAFELTDTRGQIIRLADFHGRQNIVLVLTRGFV
jgi:peroxiredoxin